MSVAKEYLELLTTTCVFHTDEVEEKSFAGLMQVPVQKVCGKPAVAVYISADDRHEGQYVCQEHAESAERDGDGPVFWQKRRLMPEAEEFEGLRLTLAEEEPSPREKLIAEAKRQGLNVDHLSKG